QSRGDRRLTQDRDAFGAGAGAREPQPVLEEPDDRMQHRRAMVGGALPHLHRAALLFEASRQLPDEAALADARLPPEMDRRALAVVLDPLPHLSDLLQLDVTAD